MGENKHKFQKLTPIDNVDLALYKDALDFVFDNPTLGMSLSLARMGLVKTVF